MKATSAQVKRCCVYDQPKNIMQQMHGNISYMLDCWANPVFHLLLLKSFMVGSGCGAVGRAVAMIPEDPGSNPVIGNFY